MAAAPSPFFRRHAPRCAVALALTAYRDGRVGCPAHRGAARPGQPRAPQFVPSGTETMRRSAPVAVSSKPKPVLVATLSDACANPGSFKALEASAAVSPRPRPRCSALVTSTGPRRPLWLPGCPGGLHRSELRLPALARPTQDQPPRLSRLLPLRLSGAARSVRGRLRLLEGAGWAASDGPASSPAGSRAHVPSSQRFNAWDASNGTSPLPFAASSKTALASAVR